MLAFTISGINMKQSLGRKKEKVNLQMTFDMINSQALDFHMLQHGLRFCVCVKEDTESAQTLFQSRKKISKTQENKKN